MTGLAGGSITRLGVRLSRQEREHLVSTAKVEARQFVPLRGGYREVPVISIDQNALIYRAANGRIVTELREHTKGSDEALASLRANETTLSTQALLHDLLLAKASDPAGPVLQELARHGQQTEPLLITSDGVLVNGNRRLAAMRELLASDPDKYSGFAIVRAAVLPDDVVEQDIEFIEASLQMAPDVKLAYGWINRRMKLRHQKETLGLSDEAIADAYRMESVDQVGIELVELGLVETFLNTFKQQPGEYSLVAELEELFRALQAELTSLPEDVRRVWQAAGFTLMDGRDALPGPIDRLFPFAPPAPANLPIWGLRRLAEEEGLEPREAGLPANARQATTPRGSLPVLERKLSDPRQSRENASLLYGLLEQLRAEHLEARAPNTAVKLVTRARAAVAGLEAGRLNIKQQRALRSEMVALNALVAALLADPLQRQPATRGAPGFFGRLFGNPGA